MRLLVGIILIFTALIYLDWAYANKAFEVESYEESSLSPEAYRRLKNEIPLKQSPDAAFAKSETGLNYVEAEPPEEFGRGGGEPPIIYEPPESKRGGDFDFLSGILDSLPEKNMPFQGLMSPD